MRHAMKLPPALLALAAALLLVACGDGDTTANGSTADRGAETAPAQGGERDPKRASVPTIVVRDGEPVGGVEELEFDAGEEVRFRVSSDAAEEVHLHGYELAKDVPAGGTVEFAFPADIEGIFEAELEELGVQILELRVNP